MKLFLVEITFCSNSYTFLDSKFILSFNYAISSFCWFSYCYCRFFICCCNLLIYSLLLFISFYILFCSYLCCYLLFCLVSYNYFESLKIFNSSSSCLLFFYVRIYSYCFLIFSCFYRIVDSYTLNNDFYFYYSSRNDDTYCYDCKSFICRSSIYLYRHDLLLISTDSISDISFCLCQIYLYEFYAISLPNFNELSLPL